MKKIIFASAAALTMGLSIATASAASATQPTPEPVSTAQFGHDPRPIPVPRDCRQVRFVDPRGGPVGNPHPYPSETVTEAALAAFHGVPSPEPSQQFGLPGHNPRPHINPLSRCLPEHFDVIQAWVGPRLQTTLVNYANATGPVNGIGSDTQLANTLDRFNLNSGRVFVRHTGIGSPIVNSNNCTVGLLQFFNWQFNGGTGLNAHAVGNGNGRLALLAHFPLLRNGVCSLNLISGNPLLQHRISPDRLTVAVHGDGLARR